MPEPTLDQIVAKWTPMTMGIDSDREASCAWAFEQESCFLVDNQRTVQTDPFLRLPFPVIRSAIEDMEFGTTNRASIHNAISASMKRCAETAGRLDPTAIMSTEEQTMMAANLTDRLHTALLSLPS